MGKIIFQLLSCLYLYDSGIQVPVENIRKQSRYTGVRRLALTYCAMVYLLPTQQGSLRKAGIPASDVLRVKPICNIGGNAIEFVRQWPHLGNLISDICDDKDDILKKRNTMCGQINNVLCFFGKVDAVIKTQLLNIFAIVCMVL